MDNSIRRVIASHFDKGPVVIITEFRYQVLMEAEAELDHQRETRSQEEPVVTITQARHQELLTAEDNLQAEYERQAGASI